MGEESRLASLSVVHTSSERAFVSRSGNVVPNRGRGGRELNIGDVSSIRCFYCKKLGHTINECRTRMRVSERGHQRAGLSNPALAASTPTTAALASP